MARFSIWEGDDCGITMNRGDGPPAFLDGTLEDPDAVMIKAFDAPSWNAACQVQSDYYGWGEYKSDDRWEEIGPDEE